MAQLTDLVVPIESQTDEELQKRLFDLRHRRETIRPAAKKHKEKPAKKEAKRKTSAAEKLLGQLSPEELAAILAELTK